MRLPWTSLEEEAGADHGSPELTISVIVPNYNHATYITEALQAVFSQTRPPDQVIIVDDASSDDSIAVIERLIAGRKDVVLVRNATRGGAIKAMNLGLTHATSDLVALLAADDAVFPDFLERTENLMRRHMSAPFCSASVRLQDLEGRSVGVRPVLRPLRRPGFVSPSKARAMLKRGDNFFLGAATLYRRNRVVEMGGFTETLGSSGDGIVQRCMAVRWGFCFLPEPLAMWRMHGSNYSTMSVTNPKTLDDICARVGERLDQEAPGLFPPGYRALFERRLRFNAGRLLALQLGQRPQAAADIATCVKAGETEKKVIAALSKCGPLAPRLVIAWLTLSLKPFSMWWLLRESLSWPFRPR